MQIHPKFIQNSSKIEFYPEPRFSRLKFGLQSTLTILLFSVLSLGFLTTKIQAQICNCNDFPGYKCITSGDLPTLISNGDLLQYADALTIPQHIVVLSDINFADPNNSTPYHFAPGSEIVMSGNSGLFVRKEVVFDQINIVGCGGWTSIEVFNTGTARILGSSISGACTAVLLKDYGKAEITGSYFVNNFNCIEVNQNAKIIGNGISHNTFDGTNYSLNCTGFRWAISVVDAPHVTIGNALGGGAPNTIVSYPGGLLVNSSNIDVHNTTFVSNNLTATSVKLLTDQGVFTANFNGLGSSSTSTPMIDNFGVGISSKDYNLNVRNARFRNNLPPIQVDNTLPATLGVFNNRFEAFTNNALYVKGSLSAATVEDNSFFDNSSDHINGLTRNCIQWSATMTGNANAYLHRNTFYDEPKTEFTNEKYNHTGINLGNCSKVRVEENTFYQNFQPTEKHAYAGVKLFNAAQNEIVSNDVLGSGPASNYDSEKFFNHKGIYAYEAGANLISCNYTDNLDNGLSFRGPLCDQENIRVNTMTGSLADLYLFAGSTIGKQDRTFNKWPDNDLLEAHFDGTPTQNQLFASLFIIHTSNTTSEYWANPRMPAIGWFGYAGVNSETEAACIDNSGGGVGKSEANNQAISGTFEAYKGYPASAWEAKLAAYRSLSANPALLVSGSADAQFYNTHTSANIGKLARAIEAKEALLKAGSSFGSAWAQQQSDIHTKLSDLRAQQSLMEQTTTTAQENTIAQIISGLQSDIAGLQQTGNSLASQYRSTVSSSTTQLLADLGNITASDLWESNLKTVLELWATRIGAGADAWTSTQQATLKSIADQCRYEGGIGVVMARAAIGNDRYNDEAMCPDVRDDREQVAEVTLQGVLAPNPANEISYIKLANVVSGQLFVYNAQGQLVQNQTLDNTDIITVPTATLPMGIYQVQVKAVSGVQFLGKLSVAH